jgi:hypothetical protein
MPTALSTTDLYKASCPEEAHAYLWIWLYAYGMPGHLRVEVTGYDGPHSGVLRRRLVSQLREPRSKLDNEWLIWMTRDKEVEVRRRMFYVLKTDWLWPALTVEIGSALFHDTRHWFELLLIGNNAKAEIAITPPTKLEMDERDRLHCENGASFIWGKNEEYHWHGITVPKEWIVDKDNVDPRLVLTTPNRAQGMALGEIIGWTRVFEYVTDLKIVQKDDYGELLETQQVPLMTDPTARFVRVIDATTKSIYVLRVSPQCQTAHEGVAWTL